MLTLKIENIMEKRVLEKILNSNSDYFLIETYDRTASVNFRKKLILISLPEDLRKIKNEKTIETITYLEVEKFEKCNIETNIFLSPSNPPFQVYVPCLCHASECYALPVVNLKELLGMADKSIYEISDYYNTPVI